MITGIGHVAFRVTSLQRALDFYCTKLGFSEAFRLEHEGQPSPWIVYIQIAPGSFIELFPDPQDAPKSIAMKGLLVEALDSFHEVARIPQQGTPRLAGKRAAS